MEILSESDRQLLYKFIQLATPISDDLFSELVTYFKKRTYTKGETILKEGEIESKSNIVAKGVVHQFFYDEDVPITTNITPKGLPFNSLKSYINKTPSQEIQEAITDVEILSIEKKDLEMLAQKWAEMGFVLYRIHEYILLDRENRMSLLQYRNPSKRFQLFHEIVGRSNLMLESTPDKFIASYLNMTPQQYSKEKHLQNVLKK
ncbi:Crp/Fnr family transcriptional regulator [Tenacibaculum sp. IB213877]|uniref:Crp/Fnr family transcriptional regulator n=1 Tax=Tenacibaculum sp. IB213877 TaxID=3097351 RepID=UPI002A5A781E|nr:Crp/Fnr family transcriptional regulator [Tenacibaculum sp. IB213877]MDY0781458.1 Crp/Fnr family transcriptional regulator [Tenacibaculum sp. IB213877]